MKNTHNLRENTSVEVESDKFLAPFYDSHVSYLYPAHVAHPSV